jgi:23S rRNA (cytosine1962-C5)-methyltransferase
MPTEIAQNIESAIGKRRELLNDLHSEDTDCYRLFHGATEGCPGLTIDRYGSCILLQTWRAPIERSQLAELSTVVKKSLGMELPLVWNHRHKRGSVDYVQDVDLPEKMTARELGIVYDARPRHKGIDPLLFLDLRAGRRRIRAEASNRSVLNLFSYTCGIGLAASIGGASEVLNVDFSANALEVGRNNASLNGISTDQCSFLHEDAIPVMRQLSGLGVKGRARRRKHTKLTQRRFDIVVLDPPRYAKSPFGLVDTVGDYQSIFKPAILCTRSGGKILATNNVASVDSSEWCGLLEKCATKAGRTIENIEMIAAEEDFPSDDGRRPLKMAWISVG